ncbi:MAG: TonB-dependent receptor [Deltaproteobacteria bacterium]|jgi:vitamin B12 transporter|nr:TonB-dependent receptor [Deltaproteobacteria bacterium]
MLGLKSLLISIFSLFILIVVSAGPTFGQQSVSTINSSAAGTLDTLVVTSSRSEESVRSVTTNITVIEKKTIESSNAKDLGSLLAEQGIQYFTYNGGDSQIAIRGFRTDTHGNDLGSHVLLLLDGRRILTGNSSLVSLANVERVEIIRGPAASQYGSAAMGGVVNVITRKGTELPLSAFLETGGGSYDSFKSLARLSGSVGQFDFSLGAIYQRKDDYKVGTGESIDDRLYKDTYYENFSINLNTGYTFLDTQRIGLVFNYSGIPDSGMSGGFAFPGENHVKRSNYLFGLDYDGSTADERFSWLVRLSLGHDNRDYLYVNDPYSTDSFYEADSQAATAQLTYENDFISLTGGVDYLKYSFENSGGALDWSIKEADYSNLALFAIAKLKLLNERLILSAGGRYDFFDMNLPDIHKKSNENHFSPSIGLALVPFEGLKFRANYSNAFAMPTADQLGSSTPFPYIYIGNPDLKPETSNTFEFGFDAYTDNINASATYFYTKTKDFITYDYVTIPGATTFQNSSEAYLSGLELNLSADLGGLFKQNFELRPFINLTHMFKYTTKPNKTSDYNTITYIPDDIISAGIYFNNIKYGLTTNLNISRSSGYSTGYGYIKGSTMVNLTINKRLFDFQNNGHLDAKLAIDNLTDDYIQYYSGYPVPGRIIYLGLSYTY